MGQYKGESAASIATMMQKVVTKWEGGICATGGALDPKKSHWYLIDFIWTNGQWTLASKSDHDCTISIKDSNGKQVIID